MSEFAQITIQTEAEFLAHVIALKNESEERLQVMADCLFEHNNLGAAEVFQALADVISQNILQLEVSAAGMQLPEIPPWEYQWHCRDNPDALCMDQAHYMMSIRQALELALFNEQRSMDFFNRVVNDVDHPEIIQIARRQISVEQEFAEVIRCQLADLTDDDYFYEDLDPPNIPE